MTKFFSIPHISLLLMLIYLPAKASAKLFLGLSVGAEAGSWASDETVIQSSTGNKLDMKPSGLIYGYSLSGRIDLTIRSFLLGAEYYWSSTLWTYTPDPDSTQDDNYKQAWVDKTTPFILVGIFGKNEKWSLWTGYSPQSTLKFKTNINSEESPNSFVGRAYKIGLGIRVSKKRIWINMEYIINSYDRVSKDGVSTAMPGSINNHTYKTLDQGVIIFTVTFKLGNTKVSRANKKY